MPLAKRLVHIATGGGLDQKTDPKQVVPGQWTGLINLEWVKGGTVQKREGTEVLSRNAQGGGSIPSRFARACAQGDILGQISSSEGKLYAYDSVASNWEYNETAGMVALRRKTMVSIQLPRTLLAGRGMRSAGIAYSNGRRLLVWSDNSNPAAQDCWVRVDNEDGTNVLLAKADTADNSIYQPMVVMCGSTAIIAYKTGANTVKACSVDMSASSPSLSATTSLRTDVNANCPVDLLPISSTDFAIAYCSTAAAPNISIRRFSVSGPFSSVSGVGNLGPANDCIPVSAYYVSNSGNYFVAFLDGTSNNIRYLVVDAAYASVLATTTITTAPAIALNDTVYLGVGPNQSLSAATLVATVHKAASPNNGETHTWTLTTTAATAASYRYTPNCLAMSRPFTVNSRVYFFAHTFADETEWAASAFSNFTGTDIVPGSGLMLECEEAAIGGGYTNLPHRVVGVFGTRMFGTSCGSSFLGGIGGVHPWVPATSVVTKFGAAVPYWLRIGSSDDGVGYMEVKADFALANRMNCVRVGPRTFFGGGTPSEWVGKRLSELGFYAKPAVFALTRGAGGSGSMGAGDYNYAIVWERHDDNGNVAYSEPYRFKVTSVPGTGSVTILGQMLPTSNMWDREVPSTSAATKWTLYRSTVGGSELYKLTTQSATAILNGDSWVPSDPDISFTDQRADSDIDGGGTDLNTRPLIYTTGNVLARVCPPAFQWMIEHRGRLWGIGDDPRQIWFSSKIVDGEQPWFNEDFSIFMPDDCTGLATMDGRLVLFSETAIYVVTGDGPNDLGQLSDLSEPSTIATNQGLSNPSSVATTPDGIMFQSASGGLYLLTRALELVFIGAQVEDTLASYPTITSATLHPTKPQVRFTTSRSNDSLGPTLVYDYLFKQWSTFEYRDLTNATANAAATDAIVVNGIWYWLNYDGTYHKERSSGASRYLDGSTWITATAETAWIKTNGIMGLQRVWRSMAGVEAFTAFDITVTHGVDYASSYTDSRTWTNQSATISQFETHLAVQKCESVRIKITDATPTGGTVGTGQGFRIFSLALQVGVKQGTRKLDASYRK